MKLLDQLSERLRVMHYAFRTEQAYRQWAERYLKFLRQRDPEHRWIHPCDAGTEGVEAFLSHLATRRRVAASTQNQALNALVFFHKQVLKVELGHFEATRAKRPARLPRLTARNWLRLTKECRPISWCVWDWRESPWFACAGTYTRAPCRAR